MPEFSSFIGGSYQSQSPVADQERSINWYPEQMEVPGATSEAVMYPTPGVDTFATVSKIGGRALFATTDVGVERVFGVFGDTLYEFFSSGQTPEDRGTVAIDRNPATICTNGDGGRELGITSGDVGYAFDLVTNTLTTVLTSGATKMVASHGYFIAFNIASSSFRISAQFDGLTWDATQSAQRTIGSDPWRALHVTPAGYLCLPGTKTGEFWYNAGTFPFIFAPDPSAPYPWGVAASFSIAQVGQAVMWLAQSPVGGYQVVAATGFSPRRVSTHALESQLSSYGTVADTIGQSYTEDGHTFFLMTHPSQGVTNVFDTATGLWHERGTWDSATATYGSWQAVYHAFAFGKHLMANLATGQVHRVSNLIATDPSGNGIRRVRRFPALVSEHERVLHRRLRVLYEQGRGLTSGQGSDPLFMMKYSNDGGRTFGNEKTRSAGKIGEYRRRVEFHRLGLARNRVYELSASDPIVGWRMMAVYLDADVAG